MVLRVHTVELRCREPLCSVQIWEHPNVSAQCLRLTFHNVELSTSSHTVVSASASKLPPANCSCRLIRSSLLLKYGWYAYLDFAKLLVRRKEKESCQSNGNVWGLTSSNWPPIPTRGSSSSFEEHRVCIPWLDWFVRLHTDVALEVFEPIELAERLVKVLSTRKSHSWRFARLLMLRRIWLACYRQDEVDHWSIRYRMIWKRRVSKSLPSDWHVKMLAKDSTSFCSELLKEQGKDVSYILIMMAISRRSEYLVRRLMCVLQFLSSEHLGQCTSVYKCPIGSR